MDLYADNILDHYRHPRGKGMLAEPTVTHEEVNMSCGDAVTVQLEIRDGGIAAVRWDGAGCAISQAAMSMLSEELPSTSLHALDALGKESMYDLLGVPIGPRRVKCALLGLHTVKNALRKFQGKPLRPWFETAGGA